MNIAKAQIRVAVKKKYGKVTVDASVITEKAKQLLQSPEGQVIMDLARQRVQEEQAAAADDLGDLIGDLPEKQGRRVKMAGPVSPRIWYAALAAARDRYSNQRSRAL